MLLDFIHNPGHYKYKTRFFMTYDEKAWLFICSKNMRDCAICWNFNFIFHISKIGAHSTVVEISQIVSSVSCRGITSEFFNI
jgi:hypothetical protein